MVTPCVIRISKDVEANPNHFVFNEMERHHAEIAAFHLDRYVSDEHELGENIGCYDYDIGARVLSGGCGRGLSLRPQRGFASVTFGNFNQ